MMTSGFVEARSCVRKMRGGAQSHLLRADDGHSYVVKFRNNPQHRRILVNELIASTVLQHLGVWSPATTMVRITPGFRAAHPGVNLQFPTARVPIEDGLHFGSRYPGDPSHATVYDFLPDPLLRNVLNLEDFLAVLVVDKWMGNADSRQCIFCRASAPPAGQGDPNAQWVASMIDHGGIFTGPQWDFRAAPFQGLYCRKAVYERVRSLDDFQPWLEQVAGFPERVIEDVQRRVPLAWIENDEDALQALLERLFERRHRVAELIWSSHAAVKHLFPQWSTHVAMRAPIRESVIAWPHSRRGQLENPACHANAGPKLVPVPLKPAVTATVQ